MSTTCRSCTPGLEKIRTRDFFGALQAHTAADALASCENALRGFAEAIYAREGLQGHAEDEGRLKLAKVPMVNMPVGACGRRMTAILY